MNNRTLNGLVIFVLLITGCASHKSFAEYAPTSGEAVKLSDGLAGGELSEGMISQEKDIDDVISENAEDEKTRESGEKDPGKVEPPSERLIIYNGQLGLSVFKLDERLKQAVALNKKYGGWVQQSTSSSLIMRVPAKSFEKLMGELEELGDVNFKNVIGTDVTEEFFDLQIRLKNAMSLRDRFIQLLAQAKTVESTIAIEKELARLTEKIERMKGRIRFLRNQAAFSTITLTLSPKQATANPGRIPLPFDWLREYNLDSVIQ